MNLRTLKKLSKRAATLLPLIGDSRDQYRAAHHRATENYHAGFVGDRKHWERWPCHPSSTPETIPQSGWIVNGRDVRRLLLVTRAGGKVILGPPSHPRKGTIMVGTMSGYHEPEWDEESAWDALVQAVRLHFTDWDVDAPAMSRELDTPHLIFAAAEEMIEELRSSTV